jgi:large subunit ribosomal protein L37e
MAQKMDGPRSFGKFHINNHKVCRRCNHHSYHPQKECCSNCGFGKSARIRSYAWQTKKGISVMSRNNNRVRFKNRSRTRIRHGATATYFFFVTYSASLPEYFCRPAVIVPVYLEELHSGYSFHRREDIFLLDDMQDRQ